MVLTLVQLTWAHVLLSAIDCLEFSRVLCNRPSSYFICNPPIPTWHPLHPLLALNAPTPPPVQASSGQEWYYCRSAWDVISLWVRLLFCQMYPHAPSKPPRERHLVAKIGINLGPVDLSSDYLEFSRVLCNRLSSFFLCKPQCPCDAPTPHAGPLMAYTPAIPQCPTATPVQASSGQEWYSCRSAWHVISL